MNEKNEKALTIAALFALFGLFAWALFKNKREVTIALRDANGNLIEESAPDSGGIFRREIIGPALQDTQGRFTCPQGFRAVIFNGRVVCERADENAD